MMRCAAAAILTASLILGACGTKVDEAAESLQNLQSIAESADNAQATQEVVEKRRAERRAKGDTLALAPDVLKGYLPASISGYTAGEPETQTMDMPGMSWSVATQQWTANNGSTIKVTLTDYNASEQGWSGANALFSLRWSVDNATEMQRTMQTDDPFINGHERYGKQDRSASVTYALGGRFLLQIEGTDQSNTDLLRSVASSIDLKKLAGL